MGGEMTKVKTFQSVESILKRELASTIKEWLRQVKLVPELSTILLIDSDRTGHLPKLFEDVLNRLRLARGGRTASFYRRIRARRTTLRAGLLCIHAS
jgi:hypothetical protein